MCLLHCGICGWLMVLCETCCYLRSEMASYISIHFTLVPDSWLWDMDMNGRSDWAQYRVQWVAFVNILMELHIPWKQGIYYLINSQLYISFCVPGNKFMFITLVNHKWIKGWTYLQFIKRPVRREHSLRTWMFCYRNTVCWSTFTRAPEIIQKPSSKPRTHLWGSNEASYSISWSWQSAFFVRICAPKSFVFICPCSQGKYQVSLYHVQNTYSTWADWHVARVATHLMHVVFQFFIYWNRVSITNVDTYALLMGSVLFVVVGSMGSFSCPINIMVRLLWIWTKNKIEHYKIIENCLCVFPFGGRGVKKFICFLPLLFHVCVPVG